MSGREAAEATTCYILDEIPVLLPMVEYFPGTGHAEKFLEHLRQQGGKQEGRQQLPGLGPSTQYHEEDNDCHGKNAVAQKSNPDKESIQEGLMKRVQHHKAGRFSL